jgi:hypothetical protein
MFSTYSSFFDLSRFQYIVMKRSIRSACRKPLPARQFTTHFFRPAEAWLLNVDVITSSKQSVVPFGNDP